MNFAEGERLLFRHNAMVDKVKGEMVISNRRIAFHVPADNATRSWVWANVQKVEYSPDDKPTTAIKITAVQGQEVSFLQMIGGKTEDRLVEFRAAKAIITAAHAGKPVPVLAQSVTTTTAGAAGAAGTGAGARSSMTVVLDEQQQHFLSSDKAMARLYDELVRGQIISDQDFWNTHRDALLTGQDSNQQPHNQHHNQQHSATKRGLSNDLWADIIVTTADSSRMKIRLTPENKEAIFRLYPHIRLAFEQEVPLNCSESDFWKKFIDAEYFKTSFHERRKYDNLFSKYEAEAKDVTTTLTLEAKKRQRFGTNVSTSSGNTTGNTLLSSARSVDLTMSFGDSKRRENLDDEDRQLGAESQHRLLAKQVFQESTALMSAPAASTMLSSCSSISSSSSAAVSGAVLLSTSELPELQPKEVPQFIPMDLSLVTAAGESGDNGLAGASLEYKRRFDSTQFNAISESIDSNSNSSNNTANALAVRARKLLLDDVKHQQAVQELGALGADGRRKDALPVHISEVSQWAGVCITVYVPTVDF
jgi:hypothetical protein